MNNRTISALFQQMIEQVEKITETVENACGLFAQKSKCMATGSSTDLEQQIHEFQQLFDHQKGHLEQSLQRLRLRIDQIDLLNNIANQYGESGSVQQVVEAALEAIWKKKPLRYVAVLLGEAELGPYIYQSMRGVSDSWRYIGVDCPFPLWGVLARALLPRLDPDEPDYLIIPDIERARRPLPEEFPWMPLAGSLMILPLRTSERLLGAFMLGSEMIDGFRDSELCKDYYAIIYHTARVLQVAQMRQELTDRSTQLVSLQLFTKSIATVRNFDKLMNVLTDGINEALGKVNVLILLTTNDEINELQADIELAPHVRRILEWTVQAGQPIFYDPMDTTEDLERFYYNESGRALVVPIIRGDQTFGVIQIVASDINRRFEEGDMIVLRTIANCAAPMLENMELRPDAIKAKQTEHVPHTARELPRSAIPSPY
ncbi:MAG: GAF domain-containing protein [Caldilineaceae bacterium]